MAAFGHYHPNFDPIKLHSKICEMHGWSPGPVQFYTGVPSPQRDPKWSAYWSNRILAMTRAGIITTTRPLRYRQRTAFNAAGESEDIVVPQEKGIDVRIALDIVKVARMGEFGVIVIYSQDQDLNEVVEEVLEIAEAQGKKITLACAYPSGPKASAKRGINRTQWIKIDETTYNACIDKQDYRPSNWFDL